jgi:hypothetical protein
LNELLMELEPNDNGIRFPDTGVGKAGEEFI